MTQKLRNNLFKYEVFSHENSLSVNLTTRTTLWNLTISTFLVWVAHLAFSQNNIQRIVSLPTLQDARRFVLEFSIMTFQKIL